MNKKEKNIRLIINFIRIVFIFIFIFSSINIFNWFKNNNETENIMNNIASAVVVETIQEEKDIIDNNVDIENQLEDNKSDNLNVQNDTYVETNDEKISSENQINSNETEETITNEKKYKIDFEYLKSQNSDAIGWIKVEGTKIEYPVVKTSDNNFYINHNFYKNKSKSGWIFADYRNKLDGNDKNIIIYGHNMRNDSMFGTLEKVLTSSWYEKEENRNIVFVTENEYSIYRVFSIYQTKTLNDSYYVTTDFFDLEYEEFIVNLKNRSIVNFEERVDTNQILTLSTCTDDSKNRIVLHAQKIEN